MSKPEGSGGAPNSCDGREEGLHKRQRGSSEDTGSTNFVASMTFASGDQRIRSCDCDECFSVGNRMVANDMVPLPIARAVELYKRQRPMKRRQDRQLLKRQNNISVWEWTLPLQADPMLELGSSHRLVLVKRLPGVLQSIGSVGIIGSQQEEDSRESLGWKQGDVILVPAVENKAMGYVHSTKSREEVAMYATLVICKIPPAELAAEVPGSANEDESISKHWDETLRSVCRELLGSGLDHSTCYKLNEAIAELVSGACR